MSGRAQLDPGGSVRHGPEIDRQLDTTPRQPLADQPADLRLLAPADKMVFLEALAIGVEMFNVQEAKDALIRQNLRIYQAL